MPEASPLARFIAAQTAEVERLRAELGALRGDGEVR